MVETGMAVCFVICRVEEFAGLSWIRCMDIIAFHHPDADAFIATRIYITGIFNRHLRICCIEASRMLMIEPLSGADEYFPDWPVFTMRFGFHEG